MRGRLLVFSFIFFFGVVALLSRLFFWQVVKSQEMAREAHSQHQTGTKIVAERGNVLAGDGSLLAASRQTWLVFVMKNETKESYRTIANKLAPLLIEDPEDKASLLAEAQRIEGMLDRKDLNWVPIKHKLPTEIRKNIEGMQIKGVGFDPEEARFYPEGSASAHVLGFVGKDDEGQDKGYFGLEGYYDLSLAGKPGFIQRESDAKGAPILSGGSKEIAAVPGVDIKTHIDKRIQILAEEKLKEGLERTGAKTGSVIVMDPKTGAIKAMAAFPSYDPDKYATFEQSLFRNPTISDSFEPGSIFKPLIMAAGLDSGKIDTDTICNVCDQPYIVDKYSIETWDKKYHPDSSMTDVLVHSDNVGMAFIGSKLGIDKIHEYLSSYGFGKLTGIDLQGEATAQLRPRDKWNIVDQATVTFGQGIATTPIQMVKAFSVIANDGKPVVPQVVDKIVKDGQEQDVKPQVGKQVISEKAARETTVMMVETANHYAPNWVKERGFEIAGKTGTAQIPINGQYTTDRTITSFMAFAPANDPKILMLVSLREPQSSPWAEGTAVPIWFAIAKELFPYLGVQPRN